VRRREHSTFTWNDLLVAVYIAIPTYVANSTPVLLGGGIPIDRGGNFIDGRRIFGNNKTVKGFASGLVLGTLAAVGEAAFFANQSLFLVGIVASLGALLGDLIGAFVKRRLDIAPGNPLPIVDQLDFILGAIILAFPLLPVSAGAFLILLVATIPIHLLANAVAYLLGLKRRLW
jgi:CDP-2,3-bis-(O-geranylgeranyl)-sn-glycerol synthase